ncbi:MAG: biopolymer transporter ExbD [Spirosomataceae bacterium]|jgi:biopolymer transport protein ExbD
MAEVTPQTKNATGRHRSERPDMTPLVDLGFLLITFFIFTTTFTQPNMMKLNMPNNETGQRSKIKKSNSLTFILGKQNQIFWHQEDIADVKATNLKETNLTINGFRSVILKKRNVAPNPENFTVIIKPTDDSPFKNLVDALDEMEITNITHFAIADLQPKELAAYKERTLMAIK